MKLNDSTRRALRTAYQFLVACIGIVPTLLLIVPSNGPLAAKLAVVLGFVTVATKVLNSLEDHQLIPAWLKTTATPEPDVPAIAGMPVPVAPVLPVTPSVAPIAPAPGTSVPVAPVLPVTPPAPITPAV